MSPLDRARPPVESTTTAIPRGRAVCPELAASANISNDGCPFCGDTVGVQQVACASPVRAWSCVVCGTKWAAAIVNPPASRNRRGQLAGSGGGAPDDELLARVLTGLRELT